MIDVCPICRSTIVSDTPKSFGNTKQAQMAALMETLEVGFSIEFAAETWDIEHNTLKVRICRAAKELGIKVKTKANRDKRIVRRIS